MKTITLKSDTLGIISSTLCMIHCIITPFLFIAQTCSDVCCTTAPTWWLWIDVSFLTISLFAISHAVKHTSKQWVKYAMWTSWSFLLLVITNEQLELFSIFENAIYRNRFFSSPPFLQLKILYMPIIFLLYYSKIDL